MGISDLSDDQLKAEAVRLINAHDDRLSDIAKRRRKRHENIDFSNPLFVGRLKEIEQEIKKRGLDAQIIFT